ncbi:hypothetical protein KIN20_012925 [Parelaphostrongylus tenuis]|uniref:Uncharacterized protein n=1 Tax=Parelaphostrongylus tenuis TaxID=148309 RepID=A0AAD5MCT0_PARTN|nr:hypothetical protein KIN20_012925 [Parelaphostrongylus tenuis]
MISANLGSYPFVIISDYKTTKDTYAKDGEAYDGKIHFSGALTEAFRDSHGMVFTEKLVSCSAAERKISRRA